MSDPIKIKIKRGLTAGNAPSVLSFGELAVNTFDRILFVGGVTGGVQDYPLQKTYVYNTYTDFVADIDAGIYGTAGDESHFQYGDLFIERNTRFQYGFLPSTTGPTSVGTWFPLSSTGGAAVFGYKSCAVTYNGWCVMVQYRYWRFIHRVFGPIRKFSMGSSVSHLNNPSNYI